LRVALSTSCFLEKYEGYIAQSEVPESVVNNSDLELQIDRGFTFNDFAKAHVKSIHLPFARFIPAMKGGRRVCLEGRNVNIASIDEKKWIRDLEYYKDVIKLSRGRGIENAIVHYGNCTCGGEAYKNPHHRELHWKMEVRFLKEVSRDLKEAEIRLLVENHPYQDRVFKNHSTHIQRIIDEKVAHLCLDLPHAFIRHSKFGDEEPMKLIEKFYRNIFEIHLADNDGEVNESLSLGTGKMPWQKLIDAIGDKQRNMLVVLELHGDPMPSMDQLKAHIMENDAQMGTGKT